MASVPSKKIIIAQIILIFVLPVALLYFNILSGDWRIILLATGSLIIYGIIWHENWTHKDMGVRSDNIAKSLPYYIVFTIFGFILLFLLERKFNMPDNDTKNFFIRTWSLFLPICFAQEFVFRSFLIPRLKAIFDSKFAIILVNSTLFTLIHVIYPNLGIGLPVAFVSGLFFAWLYIKYPNLLLISLVHSVLNITALMLGFFNLN